MHRFSPRWFSRLSRASALLVCGCLASAFIFGSSKEKQVERDIEAIQKLYGEARESEAKGDFKKALDLYGQTVAKTLDFDKAYQGDDYEEKRESMKLARTNCQVATANIRHAMETAMAERTVAVTSDLTPVNTNLARAGNAGYVVPSRPASGAAPRAVAAKPAPAQTVPAKLLPDSAEEQLTWARELMELDRSDAALEPLRAVILANPDHAEARFLFALASLQRGDAATAENVLRELAEDNPSEAVFLLQGAVFYQARRYAEALAALEEARKANPAGAAAYLNRALVLLDTPAMTPGNGLAFRSYQQALKLGAPRDAAIEARLAQP